MKKQNKNRFTAEKCNFQGVPGYTVKQWVDGVVVCSQWLAAEHCKTFFDAVGVVPAVLG